MAKKATARIFHYSVKSGRRVTDAFAKTHHVDMVEIKQADLDLAEISEEDLVTMTKTFVRASKFRAQVVEIADAKRAKAAAEKRAAKKATAKKTVAKKATKKAVKKAAKKKTAAVK